MSYELNTASDLFAVRSALAIDFPTRAAFVTWASGKTPAVGTVVSAAGLGYRYDAGTTISDLTGWSPAGDWTVLHFGAAGDINAAYTTGTDDKAAFQAAIDAKSAAGGGAVYVPNAPGGIGYRTMLGPQSKNGVTIVVPNPDTKIVCTGDGSGARWPIYGCIVGGAYIDQNFAFTTAYATSDVTAGNPSVTLTVAGNASNFAVNDVVQVETVSTFTVGGIVHPTWLQINVVTAISSGVISLRYPIDQTRTSVQLRQLTTSQVMKNGDGTTATGYVLTAVRDAGIIGGTWINTVAGAPFNGAGGMIDCIIKPHKTIASTGAAYGNSMAHCQIGEDIHIGRRIGAEVAFGSHNNNIVIGSMSFLDQGLTSKWVVAANGGARNNTFRIGSINLGNLTGTVAGTPDFFASTVLTVLNSYSNTFDIGSIVGASINGAAVYMTTVAYTGTYNDANANIVKIGKSSLGSQLRYVQFDVNTYRNEVQGDFFGAVTSDAYSIGASYNRLKGYMEFGAANGLTAGAIGNIISVRLASEYSSGYNAYLTQHLFTKENYSPGSLAVQMIGYLQAGAAYTSAAPFSRTYTIPAGTLVSEDKMRFFLEMDLGGAVGTKTVTVTFNGSNLYSNVFAAGATTAEVDLRINVLNNTTIAGKAKQLTASTLVKSSNILTGLNFTTTAYDIVVSITVASAGDAFNAREHALEAWRPRVTGRLL